MEEYWPGRLLHVATMTSHERTGEATYAGQLMPKYAVLSYTWGRWEAKGQTLPPALPVKRVPWTIPSVEESHFTVAEFRCAINATVADDLEWAWVDVACIDQEDNNMKADQVGRQASIFKLARQGCVWLLHLPSLRLAAAIEIIESNYVQISNEAGKDARQYPVLFGLLNEIHDASSIIFGDPWFSSLWTLQELFLRKDSYILSAEGIRMDIRISELNTAFYSIFNSIKTILQSDVGLSPSPMARKAEELGKSIQAAGLHHATWISNPNVQLGAARFRQTSRPEDRVYAIMQSYSIRVDKSAQPHKPGPSAGQLAEEFPLAISAKCAMLGQMFNHTGKPPDGKSWRITEASWVPDFLLRYADPRPQCNARPHRSGSLLMTGEMIPLNSIICVLTSSDNEDQFAFSLDSHVSEESGIFARTREEQDYGASLGWAVEGQASCLQYIAEGSIVLLLGSIVEDLGWRQMVGLIVAVESAGPEERKRAMIGRRLGVCLWRTPSLVRMIGELPWATNEILLS